MSATCADCDAEATHEATCKDRDEWVALCERHAYGRHEFGWDVRDRERGRDQEGPASAG